MIKIKYFLFTFIASLTIGIRWTFFTIYKIILYIVIIITRQTHFTSETLFIIIFTICTIKHNWLTISNSRIISFYIIMQYKFIFKLLFYLISYYYISKFYNRSRISKIFNKLVILDFEYITKNIRLIK